MILVCKVATEPYLVDAILEAESRINEEMSAYISEEFKITNIKWLILLRYTLLKMRIVGLNQSFFSSL
jgi:hypothetical protein